MKSKSLITCFLFFCISVLAEEPKIHLVLWQTDGNCVFYTLDERPITTFRSDTLIITTAKNIIDYPLNKVARYTYENNIDRIENVKRQRQRGITIRQTDTEIIVYNLPKGKSVSVNTIEGKVISTIQSKGEEQAVLPINHIPTKALVIMADGITYKILKR